MGLSNVAIEQREKEAEALKTFLFCSLIASVALHIGVLALNINKFFLKIPEVIEEPIEVTILETKPQEVSQLPVEITSLPNINSSSGGNQGRETSTPTETAITIIKSSIAPVAKQPQSKTTNNLVTKPFPKSSNTEPIKTLTPLRNITSEPIKTPTPLQNITSEPTKTLTPLQKLNETANNPVSTQPAITLPLKSETSTNVSSQNIPNNSNTTTESPHNSRSQRGNILGNLGNSWRNSLGKGTNSSKGIGNNSGNNIGNGNGTGISNQIDNKPKPENTPIVTAPKSPIENGSKLNRADCLKCQIKYPDRARRRGIEGNPEVAIDTDNQGNVTNVRLIRSSGDSELDEAAQKAAQEWKLTPTEAGRKGVRASVNFAIKGSQRHRQLQERQIEKEREATKKKPEKEASTSTPRESPQDNYRKTTPIITDVPSENTTRRKQESTPSESKPVSPPAAEAPTPPEAATKSPTESNSN